MRKRSKNTSINPMDAGVKNSNLDSTVVIHNNCKSQGKRSCEDGTCRSGVELCPEEQRMNQNTILIMIIVGLAVVIFLIIIYCFQQRNRTNSRNLSETQTDGNCVGEEGDNLSLYQPPPTYEEVISTNLYPPTPVMTLRLNRNSSSGEPPLTPPPNYDMALNILAQSHESVFLKPQRISSSTAPYIRRSISMDFTNSREREQSSPSAVQEQTNIGNNR